MLKIEEDTKVNFFDIFASLRKQLIVTWLATGLKYKPFFMSREVINARRNDGFTPLHLVASRNNGPKDTSIGLVPLDEESQKVLICYLLKHGADKTLCVGDRYLPYHLVNVERKMARALLKVAVRRHNETETFIQQTETTHDNPNDMNNTPGTSMHHYHIALDCIENNDKDTDMFVSGSEHANEFTTPGQERVSLSDHLNTPSSSSSCLLSTLSPIMLHYRNSQNSQKSSHDESHY